MVRTKFLCSEQLSGVHIEF